MSKFFGTRAACLALSGCLAFAGLATADDRTADKILADIKAVEMPKPPEQTTDRAAVQTYMLAQRAATLKKAKLIGELYTVDPANPELPALMPTRWAAAQMGLSIPTLKAETSAVIASSKDEKILTEAYYYQALSALMSANEETKPEALLPDVVAFTSKYPKDPRGVSLLFSIAGQMEDADAQEALFKKIETEYKGPNIARQLTAYRDRAAAERKKLARVGKPFELEFTEAITGKSVTMASLKGKVVVVDFWATWCGPCIAEMPKMKKLYAEYKDKGVEFLGISLDQPKEKGGLDKLKDYVAKNGIAWPQYYQGNYWQSEFSASWGINSIPCVFLIDADGNLASIKARGQLEKMIPEYLEKARAKKTAANP